jgi:UDP-N-acetylmuramyl pentapeptide phosphotransferase/UDP-N-acetylglucosamine-1-phosphate transferase
MTHSLALLSMVSFLVAATVVPLSQRYARKKKLLDVPNERSSHRVPTPKTGGVGIVAGALAGWIAAWFTTDSFEPGHFGLMAVLLGGAAVGFAGDVLDLKAVWRLVFYSLLAMCAAYTGAQINPIMAQGPKSTDLAGIGWAVFSVLFIVWYANLFNFMDGIDGIAGGTGAVALGALAVCFSCRGEDALAIVSLCLACAALGFLLFNWAPASVFMGDGGAVFLGMSVGALSLVAVRKQALSLIAAVFLMLPFVFDATFTLSRRIVETERFWTAHRTHVYQQMCDLGLSHRTVSAIYIALCVGFAAIGLLFDAMPPVPQILCAGLAIVALSACSMYVILRNRK